MRDWNGHQRKPISSLEMKEMYLNGKSTPEIADIFHVSAPCVYDRLRSIGVQIRSISEAVKLGHKQGKFLPASETINRMRRDQHGVNNHMWKGGKSIGHGGYVIVLIDGKQLLEHRVVWERANGKIPSGYVIHHLNGNRQDNRLENLFAIPRKRHSPTMIIDPYRNRIQELEEKINCLQKIIDSKMEHPF